VPDDPVVRALIERLVEHAELPDARSRDDLRRELESHFADAHDATGTTDAVSRFGDVTEVARGFRRAHGARWIVLYGAKVLASIAVSLAVALLLQTLVNVRMAPGAPLEFGSWFGIAARVSLLVVLLGVGAWEFGVEHLCARLERHPMRLLVTYVVFLSGAWITHTIIDHIVTPGHAILGTAAMLGAWMSTIAIVSRFDLVFLRHLDPSR
jgi:hypothetical protein